MAYKACSGKYWCSFLFGDMGGTIRSLKHLFSTQAIGFGWLPDLGKVRTEQFGSIGTDLQQQFSIIGRFKGWFGKE